MILPTELRVWTTRAQYGIVLDANEDEVLVWWGTHDRRFEEWINWIDVVGVVGQEEVDVR